MIMLEAIIDSVIGTLVSERKGRIHLPPKAIIEQEDMIPQPQSHFETTMHLKLENKIRPRLCLQELHLCATVSSRAFDKVQGIEFVRSKGVNVEEGCSQQMVINPAL